MNWPYNTRQFDDFGRCGRKFYSKWIRFCIGPLLERIFMFSGTWRFLRVGEEGMGVSELFLFLLEKKEQNAAYRSIRNFGECVASEAYVIPLSLQYRTQSSMSPLFSGI